MFLGFGSPGDRGCQSKFLFGFFFAAKCRQSFSQTTKVFRIVVFQLARGFQMPNGSFGSVVLQQCHTQFIFLIGAAQKLIRTDVFGNTRFFLFDQRGPGAGENFERHKTWDSCILANFAKMAGVGGLKPTPRPELRSRFENRLRHKFEWMVENLNVIGCVGCGRCEAACMGGSDVKALFKELKA